MLSYYLISLALILLALAIFAFRFEGKKPRTREVVVLAVMTTLAVCGRTAFFMVPQFKPMAALVIITGVSLGAESGFLVGTLSAFVSNFIFGQGPWTPFQMLGFGIIGLLAGLIFYRKQASAKTNRESIALHRRAQRWCIFAICAFGGLATFCIYGPIADMAALIMFSQTINKESALLILASGVPFNAIHAISTVIFLFFLTQPMMEKLERVKVKYALLQSTSSIFVQQLKKN